VARQALGEQEGSVVAIDPRTGAVLALWSWPSFDPNNLASHDFALVRTARALYLADTRNPLRASSYRDRFFPGSTFKVVTAAAGLESGTVTPLQPEYPVEQQWVPPQTTRPVSNFGGSTCGGNLLEIMRVSCNTAFAHMGVDLGAERMVATAQAFGFDQDVPFDLPRAVQSTYPSLEEFTDDIPKLAQTAFGQNDVQATPLQMAMVAGAVANGGVIMEPHTVQMVRDSTGEVLEQASPAPWRTAMSPASAAALRDAMVGVVANGSGTLAQIPGVTVAGKTGTAQLGTDPPSSHAWFIAFAPAEAPRVAVAVIAEAQPGVSEVTGGRVAAPVAKAVIEAVLATPDPLAPGG
jgi:penicillin-binding protein A